jgi:hypothetical protein
VEEGGVERVPDDRTFERFAGICAIVVGAGGFAYAVAFVVILRGSEGSGAEKASALFLLLGGLLTTAVLVALYERLRASAGAFALWALLLGVVAALSSAAHGGYDLANAINKPGTNLSLPSSTDPRGLMTFGVTAIAALVFGWLILRTGAFPRNLGYLALASGVLLVVIYLGRLIVLDPKSPVLLVAALLAGFIVDPLFYIWLGMELRRGEHS